MRALTFEPWRGRFERPCKGSFAPAPQSFFVRQVPFVGAGESTHAFSVLAAPISAREMTHQRPFLSHAGGLDAQKALDRLDFAFAPPKKGRS